MINLNYIGSPRGLMEYIGKEICEDCWGTGEVTTMEKVYPGEEHMAPIGSQPCHCQRRDDESDE